jgi:pyrroloquinoline quinone (PQQ) biosynthesis protein C
MHPQTEWAEIEGDTIIIARNEGEVWFYGSNESAGAAAPFATPMTCKGTLQSTVGLLDGAIKLGFERTDDQPAKAKPSLIRYVYSLVGAYFTSKDTPRNLLCAAARFEKIGRSEVSRYLEMRAQEEAGHERLALKDLEALGLPAGKIVANCQPVSVKPLCNLFDEYCAREYPIDAIGFSYCSERIAAVKPRSEVEAVKSLFSNGIDATRFLRSHSSLGSEVSHVDETIEFVSELPASDRIKVVQAVYASAVLTAQRRRMEAMMSDVEMVEELERAAGRHLEALYGGGLG